MEREVADRVDTISQDDTLCILEGHKIACWQSHLEWRPVVPWHQHPIYAIKADFLRVLGHPKRVRILELLRDGERTVGDLQAELELDSSGTSQHLGALRRLGVLESRRVGSSVFYRVRDERMFDLLEVTKNIVTSNLEHSSSIVQSADASSEVRPKPTAK